jgi:hypothetical protein
MILLLALALAFPRDDPDVCAASRFGEDPATITHQLIRGDPRVNGPGLPYRVFQDLNDCPN